MIFHIRVSNSLRWQKRSVLVLKWCDKVKKVLRGVRDKNKYSLLFGCYNVSGILHFFNPAYYLISEFINYYTTNRFRDYTHCSFLIFTNTCFDLSTYLRRYTKQQAEMSIPTIFLRCY